MVKAARHPFQAEGCHAGHAGLADLILTYLPNGPGLLSPFRLNIFQPAYYNGDFWTPLLSIS